MLLSGIRCEVLGVSALCAFRRSPSRGQRCSLATSPRDTAHCFCGWRGAKKQDSRHDATCPFAVEMGGTRLASDDFGLFGNLGMGEGERMVGKLRMTAIEMMDWTIILSRTNY